LEGSQIIHASLWLVPDLSTLAAQSGGQEMNFIHKIVRRHDALLLREISRPALRLGPWLFFIGLGAALVGWDTEGDAGKCLLLSGGLALGLAAEKFAQFQIKRIKK
jgi:hypothetical protein